MIENIHPTAELRSLAVRKANDRDYKSVRHALVDEELAAGWEIAKRNRTTTRLSRPKSHDRRLEDRVWTLLYRMGFTLMSGDGGASQVLQPREEGSPRTQLDVVALDEEVALAIECKSTTAARRYPDFASDLAKHVAVRSPLTASVKSQFPTKVKRHVTFLMWVNNFILSDNDRTRAAEASVPLLDGQDLEYYEHLVAQIGQAARYQFLAEVLPGKAVPGLELRVPAIKTKLGRTVAYTFSVTPEYLLKIAFVSHRARGKASDVDTYQRMLKKGRLRNIRAYISEGGIFPTNIVVNIADPRWLQFDRGKQEDTSGPAVFGWLTIRPAYRVAWIIDGQHRLYAYAGHPSSGTAVISVMAFAGLPASEQARLFVDINAEQRKVKQSLLQELYAELHWDAEEPEVRVRAILSKAIVALDLQADSPLRGRILKADEARTDVRCISLTSLFQALERPGFFIAAKKKGNVLEYGPLWAGTNADTMARCVAILKGYFGIIEQEAKDRWALGSGVGGGLTMNDGITVCINVLRSIMSHLADVKRHKLLDLEPGELIELVEPFAISVGRHFATMTADQVVVFRSLRGVQGQTTGTKRIESALNQQHPDFNPAGLAEYLAREQSQTTTKAFAVIHNIESMLQSTVIEELKREFGGDEKDWFFAGVPKQVRKKVDDRVNDEGGKKGGREQNFDLIDYREIAEEHWGLFEGLLAKEAKGNKAARTKWIVEVNELRKRVMHASKGTSMPIAEEELATLVDIQTWLAGSIEDHGSQES